MKKLLFAIFSLFVSLHSSSQVIWSDDFSNATNWLFTNSSTPSKNWSLETASLSNLMPTYPPVIQAAYFSTVANGFLFIGYDEVDESSNGTPIVCEATNAAPINLTGHPNVALNFQHCYQYTGETRGVRVSGDNGATWTEYQVTSDFNNPGNCIGCDASSSAPNNAGQIVNPRYESINISDVAGGQSQVLIQFFYNDNDIWGWYWAVDDVRIVSLSQSVIGTWALVPTEEAVGIGPVQGEEELLTGYVPEACFLDDSLVFDQNGNFMHYMDGNTLLLLFQTASSQCGTPVFPHDGSGPYTYTFANNQLTVNGFGAHIGFSNIINNAEISSPSNAADSITYEISWGLNGEMFADIYAGNGNWFRYTYRKTNYCEINIPPATDTQTACDSYTWIDGNTYTSSNNTATYVSSTVEGCETVVNLDLTINYSTNTSSTAIFDTQTACDLYTWIDGYTYTNSTETNNEPIVYLTNVQGCDSVVRLDLTMLNTFSTISETVCDTYTSPSGNIYTSTGVYFDTIINSAGCDSIITIDLTLIGNSTSSTIFQTVCDSYTSPSGNIYTSTGVYADTITNLAGCDSIITINLTLTGNSTSSTISETACGSYILNGQTYSSSGTYTQTLINVAGCDSTITLDLTINPNDFGIDLQANPSAGQSPLLVIFDNNTPNAAAYNFTWYFGDGTSELNNAGFVSHTYAVDGLWDVVIVAEEIATGCTDTLTLDDYIFSTGGVSCTHTATLVQSGSITGCPGSIELSCNTDASFSYQWNINGVPINGATSSTYAPQTNGTYSVTIYQDNCPVNSNSVTVTLSNASAPIISASGSITSCAGGAVILDAGAGYSSYAWSTGGTNQTETVTSSGDYTVTVMDASTGCMVTSSPYTVNASFMDPQQVCIVGMDSLSNYNRVVWEKPISDGIDYFNVYKEGNAADVYDLIGSVPYEDTAIFVDENSNTAVQAYRYKVAIVDSCGTESALGAFHKTIHLTINQGVGQTWNLIWNHYEGFGFPSYYIYRGTDPNNMTLLATIASNLNSYTDLNPPGGVGIYYQVEVVNTDGCDPLKSTDYGVSRSNIATVEVVNQIELGEETLSIYPNPTRGNVTISASSALTNGYVMYDQQGRVVLSGALKGKHTPISLERLSRGSYTIQVEGNYKPFVIINQ